MSERALRKTRVGKVVSDKMDKTIVVAIEDRVAHPLYKKVIPVSYTHLDVYKRQVCRLVRNRHRGVEHRADLVRLFL